MNNILCVRQDDCFGCTACFSICQKNAISMIQSNKGFYVPFLDKEKCINCGMCLKVCPVVNKDKVLQDNYNKYFAVKNKDDNIRFLSSSGGAFSAIADSLKTDNVIIYGAAYRKKAIEHIRIANGDISELRSSKYVQSSLQEIFHEVNNDLSMGKYVLFCGTPCQCAGMKNYLKLNHIDTTKFFLIDFICHGTLSPLLFSDFLNYCEQKEKKIIVNHCFRDKTSGWHSHIGKHYFIDGSTDSESFSSQLFTSLFYTNYSFKDSCYSCPFSCLKRVSDITLGDFWGIEKHCKTFDDNKGVSFVMINNSKGDNLFRKALPFIYAKEVPLDWTEQPHLYHPVNRPIDNDLFWQYYFKYGFSKMAIKYLKAGKIRRFLSKIYRFFIKG